MALKLYMVPASPAVRSVLLVGKALNIEFEQIFVNISKGHQLKPEFLKINPLHSVPVLEETDGRIIVDSHAISMYLVDKYKPNDPLYPQDLTQRANINSHLFFDAEILFSHIRDIVFPLFMGDGKKIPEEKSKSILKSYDLLEKLLEGKHWLNGKETTIADLACIATTTTLDVITPIDSKTYPYITGWITRSQKLPYYEGNSSGLKQFVNNFQLKMNKC